MDLNGALVYVHYVCYSNRELSHAVFVIQSDKVPRSCVHGVAETQRIKVHRYSLKIQDTSLHCHLKRHDWSLSICAMHAYTGTHTQTHAYTCCLAFWDAPIDQA